MQIISSIKMLSGTVRVLLFINETGSSCQSGSSKGNRVFRPIFRIFNGMTEQVVLMFMQ